MTLQEFIAKYTGKGIDWDGYYGFQCVDLYRMYVQEVLRFPQSPSVSGAKDIWTSYLPQYYDKITNTPTGIPKAGDIMIWGASYGKFGHVAVVISATLNTFTCFSQNDPINTLSGTKKYTSYNATLGWLHPKTDANNYKGYDLTNLESMKVAVDVLVQLQSGDLIRKEELEKLLAEKEVTYGQTLKDKISDLETKVGTLNQAMAEKSLEVNHLRTELETQERDNADLSTQLSEARGQRETFRTQAEDWQNKALNFEKALDVANADLNASKSMITALQDDIKQLKVVKLSDVDAGLLIQELWYRMFRKK